MATQTMTQEEYRAIQDANKKTPEKIIEKISYVTKNIGSKATGFMEGLGFVIMIFFYFLFTGLAILMKRKIPDFWVELAKPLEAGRIAEKVQKAQKDVETKRKAGKMRVVDLETGQSISH